MIPGTVPNGEYGRIDLPSSGAWLSLSDAVREANVVRRIIYRLVADGKLRSREGENGEIQIWLRDDERASEAVTSSFEVAEPAAVTSASERRTANGSGLEIAAILAPLSASYERNVQLAHENGTLMERTSVLERELSALRDSAVFDKRALQHVTDRLRALEARQAEPTQPAPTVEVRTSWGSVWWWLWLVPGILLCLVVAVVWFVGWPL